MVTGGTGKEYEKPNPANIEADQVWLSNSVWNSICELSELPVFKDASTVKLILFSEFRKKYFSMEKNIYFSKST